MWVQQNHKDFTVVMTFTNFHHVNILGTNEFYLAMQHNVNKPCAPLVSWLYGFNPSWPLTQNV